MSNLPGNGAENAGTAALATALGRNAGDAGAKVLAQGTGAAAAQIAAVAAEHNVPVLQDFALSAALQKMPVGTQIPEPLFKALAGLLDYVFREERALAQLNESEQ